jgi:hypothetical protein
MKIETELSEDGLVLLAACLSVGVHALRMDIDNMIASSKTLFSLTQKISPLSVGDLNKVIHELGTKINKQESQKAE